MKSLKSPKVKGLCTVLRGECGGGGRKVELCCVGEVKRGKEGEGFVKKIET